MKGHKVRTVALFLFVFIVGAFAVLGIVVTVLYFLPPVSDDNSTSPDVTFPTPINCPTRDAYGHERWVYNPNGDKCSWYQVEIAKP